MTYSKRRIAALLLSLGCVAPICAAQDIPAAVSGRFTNLDANQDGVLSKYEYDADAVFTTMDSDENSRVSADELQAFLGPEEDGAPSAVYRIAIFDRDDDGELSDEEIRPGMEFRFQWLDSNSDGNVDLAELNEGFGVPRIR